MTAREVADVERLGTGIIGAPVARNLSKAGHGAEDMAAGYFASFVK
ncbi:hypothetical protein SAMN04489729_7334 [Amycolatopsis lurida]|nr:hypothetical protein [Amycolatopsis lurida]SEE38812.1 hypothetical protein SAMN04489729_7334 [Amycolatopsis lurida]